VSTAEYVKCIYIAIFIFLELIGWVNLKNSVFAKLAILRAIFRNAVYVEFLGSVKPCRLYLLLFVFYLNHL